MKSRGYTLAELIIALGSFVFLTTVIIVVVHFIAKFW